MSFQCSHCDEEPDHVSRTGDKRYACGACNMVVKYDDVAPHLDDIEVNDKRGNDGDTEDNSGSSNSNNNQSNQGGQTAEEPVDKPNHNLNEREIIYERGKEGLKEIKQQRLEKWLQMTDNVGSQTQNRIIMVFDSDEIYSSNPSALYQLLDEELNASSSYINTIVNNVFAPEYEHEDILEGKGYNTWFNRSNQGGGRSMGGQRGQRGGQGYNQGQGQGMGRQGQQQGFNPQGQGQGGQPQQQQMQQSQNQQQGSEGMTKEEMVEAIGAAVSAQEEQSSGGLGDTAKNGLSEATEASLANMAENVGGFFGAFQGVMEEAFMQYAKENPEIIVENMDFVQSFIKNKKGNDRGSPSTNNVQSNNPQDQKIDAALSGFQGGNQQQNQGQNQQQSQQSQQQGQMNQQQNNLPHQQPQQQMGQKQGMTATPQDQNNAVPDDNGFEPNEEIKEKIGETNDRSNSSNNDGNSNTEEVVEEAEKEAEEEWNELFGDLSE